MTQAPAPRATSLRTLRIRAGFRTQESLAEYLGVTRVSIWRWETRRAAPPPGLRQLLDLLITTHPNQGA